MVPKFTLIHYFARGKTATTIRCAHSLFSPIILIIFVTVFTVDKVIASTKYLHLQLQTWLLVVSVNKYLHLQPLRNCRCRIQHCLGKMLRWFLQKVYKTMPRKADWRWHIIICELSYHVLWSLMTNHIKTNDKQQEWGIYGSDRKIPTLPVLVLFPFSWSSIFSL